MTGAIVEVVREMVGVAVATDSTEEEREAALDTIEDALDPEPAIDLETMQPVPFDWAWVVALALLFTGIGVAQDRPAARIVEWTEEEYQAWKRGKAAASGREVIEQAGKGRPITVDGKVYEPGSLSNPWPRVEVGATVYQSLYGRVVQGNGFRYAPDAPRHALAGNDVLAPGNCPAPTPGGDPVAYDFELASYEGKAAWKAAGRPGVWIDDRPPIVDWRVMFRQNGWYRADGTRCFNNAGEKDLSPCPPPPGGTEDDWKLYKAHVADPLGYGRGSAKERAMFDYLRAARK